MCRGPALDTTDYTSIGTQPVSFGIGAISGTIDTVDVTPFNDLLVEGDETLNLSLGNLGRTLSRLPPLGNPASVVPTDYC